MSSADEAPRLSCNANRRRGCDPGSRDDRPDAHRPYAALESDHVHQGLRHRSQPVCGDAAAEKRGYTAGHFSFNVPGGRCEVCQGDGTVTVEMQFLADVELVCDECKGTRFKSSILDIKYKGLNVHEVLQLTVREAIGFFHDTGRLVPRLKLLDEVGLGYLRLGQSATTLSGGEAQRVKLAAHLAQSTNSGTLFICDEPTTGLHFDDIRKLLAAFERLIDNGGSLLVIEHNLDVIQAADWIIDMGPEGGEGGGRIVAEGTPEEIAAASGIRIPAGSARNSFVGPPIVAAATFRRLAGWKTGGRLECPPHIEHRLSAQLFDDLVGHAARFVRLGSRLMAPTRAWPPPP